MALSKIDKKGLEDWANRLYNPAGEVGVSTDVHGHIRELIERFDLSCETVHAPNGES